MKVLQLIILTFFISCNSNKRSEKEVNKPEMKEVIQPTKPTIRVAENTDPDTEIIETFVDSLHIGEKGKYKIQLIKHSVFDDNYIIIKFYKKGKNSWYIQNTYSYETNSLSGLEPFIADFNNDKFNDITFISGTAARGSNEVRRLFIYDSKKQELISIVNSEDYPNMLYNKELNCIDAFLVHGGTSTIFAKIKGDSLIQFASVHNDNYRWVFEIDKFGKEKLLSKDTIIKDDKIYIRYKNYKPLKEYDY